MGSVSTQTYDPGFYASLPSLRTAYNSFQQKNAETILYGPIKDLFLAWKPKNMGVALLHRHFPLRGDERLVEYEHTSTPWQMDAEMKDSLDRGKGCLYGGIVYPRAWAVRDGPLVPYEFEFHLAAADDTEAQVGPDDNFVEAFASLVLRNDLHNIFGLRRLQTGEHKTADRFEITQGRANLTLPLLSSQQAMDALIPAVWDFSEEYGVRRCHCREYCLKGNWGHEANHGCS